MATKKQRSEVGELKIRLRWAQRQLVRKDIRIKQLLEDNHQKEQYNYFDDLTGDSAVLSRKAFMQRLHNRLTEVDESDKRLGIIRDHGILFIDLDEFKLVNDIVGHEAGDVVLRAFACAVQEVLRGSDMLGRIGGDEFAVAVRVRGEEGLQRVKQRIETAIHLASVKYEGEELPLDASIGATLLQSEDGNDAEKAIAKAMRRADVDMYNEKDRRRLAR